MARRLPPHALHQFAPLDAPPFFRRFFAALAPRSRPDRRERDLAEHDRRGRARGVPLAMVNARMSERSFRRWTRRRDLRARCSDASSCLLAQSAADAERLLRLGARAAPVIGNMKFDAPPPPADLRELAELSGLVAGRRLWIAASTHPGEERAAAEAHRRLAAEFPDLLTLIAPRHPERGAGDRRGARRHSDLPAGCARSGERPERDCARLCLRHHRRTRAVLSAGRRRVRRQIAVFGRRPESDRARQARQRHPAWAACRQFRRRLRRRSTPKAAPLVARDAEELASALGALFRDAGRLRAMARLAAEVVERRGGAVERALAALVAASGGARAVRAPRSWREPAPGLDRAARCSPLGALYGAATARRMARPGARVAAPVLCVGNFVVGGAGKTPTAIALARTVARRAASGRRSCRAAMAAKRAPKACASPHRSAERPPRRRRAAAARPRRALLRRAGPGRLGASSPSRTAPACWSWTTGCRILRSPKP